MFLVEIMTMTEEEFAHFRFMQYKLAKREIALQKQNPDVPEEIISFLKETEKMIDEDIAKIKGRYGIMEH